MGLKRLTWRKYLFVNQTRAQAEQSYWLTRIRRHLYNEHVAGFVGATSIQPSQTSPASLSINISAGRAIDSDGDEIEVGTIQQIDLTSLRPAVGTQTVYVTIVRTQTETDQFFIEETGEYEYASYEEGYTIQGTTTAPSDPTLEVCRISLSAAATQITDAADPTNPGTNEIDERNRSRLKRIYQIKPGHALETELINQIKR